MVVTVHYPQVRVLVDAGADVNQARLDGHTPLSLVSKRGSKELIRILTSAKRKEVDNSNKKWLDIYAAAG